MDNDPIGNRILVERTSPHAFPLHSSSYWNTIYNHRLTNLGRCLVVPVQCSAGAETRLMSCFLAELPLTYWR